MGNQQSEQNSSAPTFTPKADLKQIAGEHYKKLFPEPWNVITAWNLGYLDGTALKYIARWKDKNGIEDLEKAIHFLQKTIEVETLKQASAVSNTKLPNDSWGSK